MGDNDLMARLIDNSMPEPNSGCWLWMGFAHNPSQSRHQWGAIKYKNKKTLVGRAAYIARHGDVPAGLHVLHKCDNGFCCNPDHVRTGTHAENMMEMKERWRVRGHHKELSIDDVRRIRALRKEGLTNAAVAAQYGMNHKSVSRIASRKRWAWVEG